MNPNVLAVLGTAGLGALAALFEANGVPALLPVVLFSSVWAYRDADRLDAERYEGWMGRPSIQVAIRVLLLWIIAFPAYLALRQRILRGQAERRPSLSIGGGALHRL